MSVKYAGKVVTKFDIFICKTLTELYKVEKVAKEKGTYIRTVRYI